MYIMISNFMLLIMFMSSFINYKDAEEADESYQEIRKNDREITEGRMPAWMDDADDEERYKF